MNTVQIDTGRLTDIGYDSCIASCGNFMVLDHTVMESRCHIEGLVVLPLKQAFDAYPHVREKLFFNVVSRETSETTLQAAGMEPVGYYVFVEPGVRIEEPLQAAFLFGETGSRQFIHNIIELGEGAELNIVNGCTTATHGRSGTHVGITETYLGKNAHLGYTMIHNWGHAMEVFPVGAVSVGEGARYISNYVGMTEVRKIVTNPIAHVASGGSARFYSVIFSKGNSYFDTGARVILKGENASGEIISRVVSEGGTVVSRQLLSGEQAGTFGHMECSGLLLNENGVIHSIPELKGAHPDINLAHEAAVGKISREELSYLMTRGLTEEQARSLIIRGFLDIKIEGLPEKVQSFMNEIINRSVEGSI
ncbi:MAG: SufB/SufD family protein [Desulfomonilia bacterium]|jgi:Fe-S cluster assembly scaffold protein SufB|uniref:FeS cluster assembly protein SufB n=1 Tax=anaerobic digester metagenome TaxID=1263854 RepID=A0A485M5G9_9ZZZZ|nr:SufD family Fe-S cluster assembly protein [Deltaproteobacteria bacterium]HPX17229.1 SufD family Fe-S cluster assembly protein [Deltaproteobacteria bacterium]